MFLSRKEEKRAVCVIAAALAAIALLRTAASPSVEAGSWGLSFRQEGQTPTGTVSQQVLDEYDSVYIGDTTEMKIYLTFDAGYENGYTSQILDVLAEHQVPAAFFLVGNYLETAPDLVRRMVEEGHTVGNHTYHHYDMSKISDESAFQEELASLEALYQEVTGEQMPRYYRPPQGCYSEDNLRLAQQMGYQTVFWSLAYVDWNNDAQPTQEEAFSKLIGRIHNGAVVLLHATSATNAEILDELLTQWENLGYEFGTLDELFSRTIDF